jgi:RimJ/RimL family protein N-acetyltransferase
MPDPFGDAASYEAALPPLDTARLRLRALTAADDPALVALYGDARAMETWVMEPFTSPDDARAYRAHLALGFSRRTLFVWGVFTRDEGALIGAGLLARWAPNHRRVYIGWYLASAHWGRGYATEAAGAVAAFAFEALGCHRVEAEVVPENVASKRVAERLGFAWEARLKERLWSADGHPEDCDLFYLLKPDWEASRRPQPEAAA